MFGLLKKRAAPKSAPGYSGPEDRVVYAVGDIHGCLAELDALLTRIADDIARHGRPAHLVFLGDYVDRGPDSAGVIERLSCGHLPGKWHDFLLGNHEEVMLRVVDGELSILQDWLRFGGLDTLASYGIDRSETLRLRNALPDRLSSAMPAHHIAFLRAGKDMVRLGDYLFVHAGVRPGTALDAQERSDLFWIRGGFLEDEESDHGAMIVHGHSISAAPDFRRNRIGIDTGCYRSGTLTALVVEGPTARVLSVNSAP